MTIDIESAHVVHPGDTVILSFASRLTMEHVQMLKDQCAGLFPADVKLLVVDGATVTIVHGDTQEAS